MKNLLEIPIQSVITLTPEFAVIVVRSILRAECSYANLSPTVLTISSKLTTADGGIDAEVNILPETILPVDCLFKQGLTGFQIKSGTAFKPWTPSAIRSELLDVKGQLLSEVRRLVQRQGCYTLLCTGHDLTPEQRNDSRSHISTVLAEVGFERYTDQIVVLGASQIVEFAERYPGVASLLAADPIKEAWVLSEWLHDAHMANTFDASAEQSQLIARIRRGLLGESKHIRVLGEPGLGKTRIVLESVKDESIAPFVLYIQHGARFGETSLFRYLLKSGYQRPLVLIIDELPELELADIWRHLKLRCGNLKIVSMDHGSDVTHDDEIHRLYAPSLPDETIKKILVSRVGDSRELDRWVTICEGSPRVALAVADNLRANLEDLLKPPSTVPIWSRFLHGYGTRDDSISRQIDCIAQHLALFSRFGYENPVSDESVYIAELIRKVDPTIGWAQFQEVIQNFRARRVLQGSRTLFFVPKALHIYLWKKFWERYGRNFDFTHTFMEMPESLHAWFMNMFKYADGAATAYVIEDILRLDGTFSKREMITSAKGARFLTILAEANPSAVLKLLEATIGTWTDKDLLNFKENRQNLVWALEIIAVWPALTVRALEVLARFAVNENADFSNNASGTLIGLFRIGPEESATEATPETRLPAILKLLRTPKDAERQLGLKAMSTALKNQSLGFRMVGPEYQGLKNRAKLWVPETYGELWQAKLIYFEALVCETKDWPLNLHAELGNTMLTAVKNQIRTPPCTELAFQVLSTLIEDSAMSAERINNFFQHWRAYDDDGECPEITRRLRSLERRYTKRNLSSRFQRYVIDVDWLEWNEDISDQPGQSKNRPKVLVNALVGRITRAPEKLNQIQHLLTPEKNTPALGYFGEQLAHYDEARAILQPLIQLSLEKRHHVCLHGYLSAVRGKDPSLYFSIISALLEKEESAWLGATIALWAHYDDRLFLQCLFALEKNWLHPSAFSTLRYGKAIEAVPPERTRNLLYQLKKHASEDSNFILIELLAILAFDDSSPFDSEFVFDVISKNIPGERHPNTMRSYHWRNVCLKLIKWDVTSALSLLDVVLSGMGKVYRLSYDSNIVALANELVRTDPSGSWKIVSTHFEKTLPKWRSDLFSWLKGGLSGFDEKVQSGAIADLPMSEIIKWIEIDRIVRAPLIARSTLGTLDDEHGGRLTRVLLSRYGYLESVQSGISATFHSGGWSGPASAYLKRKRENFRRWLASGFEIEITQWIEGEIEYLDRRIQEEEIIEERSQFD